MLCLGRWWWWGGGVGRGNNEVGWRGIKRNETAFFTLAEYRGCYSPGDFFLPDYHKQSIGVKLCCFTFAGLCLVAPADRDSRSPGDTVPRLHVCVVTSGAEMPD